MTLRITVTLLKLSIMVHAVVTAVSSTTTAMGSSNETNGCANTSWEPDNRSCYLYVPDRIGFYQANESCKTLDSNLVFISSYDENQFIHELVGMQRVWIGLYRSTNESCSAAECANWMWLDESEVLYTKWAMVFPTPGQCVHMSDQNNWGNNELCSRELGYVCEDKRIIPTTTSEPTTTMSAREVTSFSDPAGNVAPATDSSKTNNDGSNMTLIIGCAIGGLVVSGIIVVAVVVLVKRHRKNKISLPKDSSQQHRPLSYRNSSHTDHATRNMDRKSPRKTVEQKSLKRDQPKKDKGKKSHQEDQQKNHNIDETPLKGTPGLNLGYCHEDVELGETTSAHGGGYNPEPVYAEPIKKNYRPRSEGVKVQENSLYACSK